MIEFLFLSDRIVEGGCVASLILFGKWNLINKCGFSLRKPGIIWMCVGRVVFPSLAILRLAFGMFGMSTSIRHYCELIARR